MTYTDVVNRARSAYQAGLVKSAANDYNGDVWAQQEARKANIQNIRSALKPVIFGGNGNESAIAEIAARSDDPEMVYGIAREMANTKGLQDMNEFSLNDPEGGNIQVPIGEERNGVAAMQENRKAIDAENARQRKNLGIGAGIGAGVGLGVGAGAYGLAGLFPSLRKRRLLRALIAMGAGGAAGIGAGYGITHNLNNGKIQGAYGKAKDAVSAGKGRVSNAIAALKGGSGEAKA